MSQADSTPTSVRADDLRSSSLGAEFGPVQFLLDLMEGVVADVLGLAQRQDRAAGGADGATPQRIGGERRPGKTPPPRVPRPPPPPARFDPAQVPPLRRNAPPF